MPSKFKIGDKVLVKKHPDNHSWIPEMDRFDGTVGIIKEGNSYDDGYDEYYIEGNDFYFDVTSLTLLACQCQVKNCMTHRASK